MYHIVNPANFNISYHACIMYNTAAVIIIANICIAKPAWSVMQYTRINCIACDTFTVQALTGMHSLLKLIYSSLDAWGFE